jgi:hypothetical protein
MKLLVNFTHRGTSSEMKRVVNDEYQFSFRLARSATCIAATMLGYCTKLFGVVVGSRWQRSSSGFGRRKQLTECKVAANILNKQPRTGDKGWFSSLAAGNHLTATHHSVTKNYPGLGKDRIKEDQRNSMRRCSLDLAECKGQHGNEPPGSIKCCEYLGWLSKYLLLT